MSSSTTDPSGTKVQTSGGDKQTANSQKSSTPISPTAQQSGQGQQSPQPATQNDIPIEGKRGGIPPIRPEGVSLENLPRILSDPNFLPPLNESSQIEEAISLRLRYASIPIEFWSHDVQTINYQNVHRMAKIKVMIDVIEFCTRTKFQLSERLLHDSTDLVIANIFRAFPSKLPEIPNERPDPFQLFCLKLIPQDNNSNANSSWLNPNDPSSIQTVYSRIMTMINEDKDDDDNANTPVLQGEEEVQPKDPLWPFIRWVYDYFLRYVVGEVEPKPLRRFITPHFITRLLELFHSQDTRERELLKTLLHRIYAKFMTLRSFIRRSMNNVLYTFIYETESLMGVSELLEILGSIINGFAQPLKHEHCLFFKYVLTPMHKVRSLPAFSPQLTYCICQFILKDPSLAESFIHRLVRYWPTTHPTKEAVFIEELYEVLERIDSRYYQSCIPVILQAICKSLSSLHTQVSGKALTFLTSDFFIQYSFHDANLFETYVRPALIRASTHWNESMKEQFRATIHQRISQTVHHLPDNQKELVELCAELDRKESERKRISREKWEVIEESVKHIVSKYEPHGIEISSDQYLPPY